MVWLMLIFLLAHSTLLLEYKFWKNYGQVVYDYSGNLLHGLNGNSKGSNENQGIFTDRGIYLNQNARLQIPKERNNNTSFLLPEKFSIIFWAYSDNSIDKGRLFCRYKPSMYILFFRDKTNNGAILSYFGGETLLSFDIWFPSNSYLDVWVLISLEIVNRKFIARFDHTEILDYIYQDYIETSAFIETDLGTDNNNHKGFGGFVAYFAIDNTLAVYSNYISGPSSDCLIGVCLPCDISYNIPDLGNGCEPSSMDINQDAYGNLCSDSYPCYGSLKIKCNCPSLSCLIESSSNCGCLDYTTGSSYTTACTCSSIGQGCCLEECESCETEEACLTCKDENSIVASNGRCECKAGYYTEGSITTNPCKVCLDECSECINGRECTICKVKNTEVVNGRCFCKNGFYNASSSDVELCSPCDSKCAICEDSQYCKSCKSGLNLLENGQCACKENYWYNSADNICKECSKNCKTCESESICISCKNKNQTLNEEGLCVCNEGYFQGDSNDCEPCDATCKTCENSEVCLTCINSNYELINGTKCLLKCSLDMERTEESCTCKFGYILNQGNCSRSKFNMIMSVSKLNKVKLSFDQELSNSLNKSEISIQISETSDFEFNLTEINKTYYLVTFVFQETIPNSTEFFLNLQESVISNKGSKLETSEYQGNLFEFIYIPTILKNLFEKTKAVSKSMAAFSLLSSIISNPAASWALLNTLQIIPYIPIIQTEISSNIDKFCSAIGDFDVIPNFMGYVFDTDSASEPFDEAQKIGFRSSLFFINFGQIIILFIANILILPLIYILSRFELGVLSLKFKKIMKNYKYSFFIRFWIQSSLDIGFFAIIQLKSVKPI